MVSRCPLHEEHTGVWGYGMYKCIDGFEAWRSRLKTPFKAHRLCGNRAGGNCDKSYSAAVRAEEECEHHPTIFSKTPEKRMPENGELCGLPVGATRSDESQLQDPLEPQLAYISWRDSRDLTSPSASRGARRNRKRPTTSVVLSFDLARTCRLQFRHCKHVTHRRIVSCKMLFQQNLYRNWSVQQR